MATPIDVPDWTDHVTAAVTIDGAKVTATITGGTVTAELTGPVQVTPTPTEPLKMSGTVGITGGTVTADFAATAKVAIEGNVALAPTTKVAIATAHVTVAGTVGITGGTVTATVHTATITTSPTEPLNVAGPVTLATSPTEPIHVTGPVTIKTPVQVSAITEPVTVKQVNTVAVQGVAGGTAIGVAGSVDIGSGTVDIGTVTGAVSVTNVTDTVLETGSALTLLGSTTQTAKDIQVIDASVVARVPYSAVLVMVDMDETTGKPYCVEVSDGSFSTVAAPRMVAPVGVVGKGAVTRTIYQAVVPAAAAPTTFLVVTLHIGLQTVKTTTVKVSVYALTTNPGVQLRPDGRAHPIGSHYASLAATGTLIAAPTSPLRILLHSLSMNITNHTAGAEESNVTLQVNGVIASLLDQVLLGTQITFQQADIPPQGLLLDAATAVTLSMHSEWGQARATYDLVV